MVAIPKGAVPEPAPILEERWSAERAFSVNGGTIVAEPSSSRSSSAGLLGRAVVAGRGRDRRYQGSPIDQVMGTPSGESEPVPMGEGDAEAPVEFAPPEDMRPGQVGTLIDERANVIDVTATIVDLAVRGYLHDPGDPEGRAVRQAGLDDGRGCEARRANCSPTSGGCSTALFRDGDEVTLSRAARRRSRSGCTAVEESLYTDAMRQKWFRARPDKVRGPGGRGAASCSRSPGRRSRSCSPRSDASGLVGTRSIVGGLVLPGGATDAGQDGEGDGDAPADPRVPPGDRDRGAAHGAMGGGGERLHPLPAVRDRVRAHRQVGEGVRSRWRGPDADTSSVVRGARRVPAAAFAESIDGFTVTTGGNAAPSTPAGSGSSGFGGGGFSGRRRRRWGRRLVVRRPARSMGDVHIVVSEDARDFQRRNWSALVQRIPPARSSISPRS